ncbi:MAG: hypothetical protein VB058_05810 [Oscillospiraceae bacterium]|nr:hypothetical protein [Oscillospiraceae bacterium]
MALFGRKTQQPPAELAAKQDDTGKADPTGAMLLTKPAGAKMIGEEDIKRATEILQKYKAGKGNLEQRLKDEEYWYKVQHNLLLAAAADPNKPRPTSGWLFNTLANKHADAMDNYPRANALPREQSDTDAAKELSSVLPCISEINNFEQTYNDNWWEKLKHGTGVYFTGWDKDAENGLGEITQQPIDLMNVFWEPGITNIQRSRNLFIVDLVCNEDLETDYPQLQGTNYGNVIDVAKYTYEDDVDTSGKSMVIDWYYHARNSAGQRILHLCKFVGTTLLYASQNDPEKADTGIYAHGMYPVDFDVLFPQKGSPAGFGWVALCKNAQLYIDQLGGNILKHSAMATQPRYWCSKSAGVNKEQFLDWSGSPIVDVDGQIGTDRLQPITVPDLDDTVVTVMQLKIDELKECSGNRDVNSGSTGSGVTAAAAISALQEAGNKGSRDSIKTSYRCYANIEYKKIELVRQLYDVSRVFRISGTGGSGDSDYQFMDFSNAKIIDQQTGITADGSPTVRRPIFDIRIVPEKKSPYSQMTQNEYAKEFYQLGFFSPDRAQETMIALSMMDFDGIDQVRDQVKQGQTLLNIAQQQQAQITQLTQLIGIMKGGLNVQQGAANATGGSTQQQTASGGKSVASSVKDAQTANRTAYQDTLAKRSIPDMTAGAAQ